jgi:hypothetical protein
MKNLDNSLLCSANLDESISNADGFGVGLSLDSNSPAPIRLKNIALPNAIAPKQAIIPQLKSNVELPPAPAPTVSDSENSYQIKPSKESIYPTPYFGGGGGGSSEPVNESYSREDVSSDKKIFGFNEKYVYLSVFLVASAFVYLKFIKK